MDLKHKMLLDDTTSTLFEAMPYNLTATKR